MPNNKIKVLFVSPFTQGGGACRNMFNIINQLDDNYTAQLIVTGDDTLPDEYKGLIKSQSLNRPSVTGAFGPLSKTIKSFGPDYIFSTTLNTGLLCAMIVKLNGIRCKTIARCTVTPSEIYHHTLKNKLLRKALQVGGRLIDVVIAQTEFMRNDLIDHYKLPSNKVKTIRNIVDIKHVIAQSEIGKADEFQEHNYNVLAVGALYSVKGFDLLIEAIAPIIREMPKVHLYIIGNERYEDGYRKILQDLIDNLGVGENIHLIGHKDNPFPYYKAADLFVLSSRKEGYPNVVLESIALNTPVVATDVVDFTDIIIDGVNGFIVKKHSIESLRNGIRKAIEAKGCLCAESTLKNYDFKNLFC